MKKLLINQPAVKLSLLFTTVVALSIWMRNNPIFIQHEKLSVPVTTSTTIPNNSAQQIQPQVYWLRSERNKLADCLTQVPQKQAERRKE